jgi:hypothetical protein
MSSSENPPATKCHKNCHKRDALRGPRKAKGPCGKRFCHTGRLVSGEGGIRTTRKTSGNSALLDERAAESDALAITDPELLQVVHSWPDLSDPIKLAILALVRSRLA